MTQQTRTALAPTLVAATLSLVAACGGETEIQLSTERESISAGGIDSTVISARAFLSGDPVKAGTDVEFNTTGGAFDDKGTQYLVVAADGGGTATVKLYSGMSEGTATVTASFSDDTTGLYASSSISITFTAPSGSQTPVDGDFRLTCDAVNIGAFREPVPDIEVTCNLSALTRGGQTIPASAFNPTFLTEAGSVTPKKDPYTDEQVFIYSPKGGASAPRDLEPEQPLNEPSYHDLNGKLRNPRDGLATIIAVVDGEEAFTDANGNGEYDQGEPFVDTAEPFVDVDDDDEHDPDEKYLDINDNSRWDQANGQWDATTKIMAAYKILWTGKLDDSPQTTRIERLSSTIANGGKLELKAFLLDANLNPVAAFQGNQDYLEWTLVSMGDAVSNDSTTPPMDQALGFSFDKAANTERKRWRILANSFAPDPFVFTVEDGYSSETDPATNFTVSATEARPTYRRMR
jgi:hypothetical protein